MYAYCLNDDE
jgi:hypothetical protein